MKMPLKTVAEEYFSHLNPIAARMYVDMNETKLAYEDLWNTLSENEQNQILSESIIKPEISIKYKPLDNGASSDDQDYAIKYILDDNNCSYRDEHSGPFTFKTRSQRNLNLFNRAVEVVSKQAPATQPLQQPRMPPRLKPKAPKKPIKEDASIVVQKNPVKDHVIESADDSGLPKTGLDFLDNW